MENSEYKTMEWTMDMTDRLCQVLFPKYIIRRSRDYIWIKKDFMHIAAVGLFYSDYSKRHMPSMYKKRDIRERTKLSVTTYGSVEYSPLVDFIISLFRRMVHFVIDTTDGGFFNDVESKIAEFAQAPKKEVLEKMETLQDSPVGKF